jgi:hypothetical protein
MVAVFVVEAGPPTPFTLRPRLRFGVPLDVAMVMPVVAGCFDNRKSNEPNRYASKHAPAVAGLSVFDGSQNYARSQHQS